MLVPVDAAESQVLCSHARPRQSYAYDASQDGPPPDSSHIYSRLYLLYPYKENYKSILAVAIRRKLGRIQKEMSIEDRNSKV